MFTTSIAASNKLICKNYPSEFILDKKLAKEYFRQFGKLKRVTFKTNSRICTVEYSDNVGFQNALKNAGEYNGTIFNLTVAHKSPERKNKNEKLSDPIWVEDDDVQAELEAMSGVSSRNYNLPTESINNSQVRNMRSPKLKRGRQIEEASTIKKKIKLLDSEGKMIPAEKMDLVNIILSQARNVEDKYRILDARDKLFRIKFKKSIHLKSTATIGTCPDMCPEKERLMREAQHQVALYEQEDNSRAMNHYKAIKQYSRSSADQEIPLPNELRPVPVLKMTMNYLLHNIVDLCDTEEVNLAEWFHFLWDRTRGIRKDITQQELCCQGAVELVEQCARFHIHSSARLVAEDPSVFDQKINTENLTKCLQTLKYMYHDLLLKGQDCPNEAEFRAYIILLNISDGNFMWEVQQLREDIQKSKEVKFALKVYSAVDKNNYVEFFKLVYSTTYLNACILMRYFMQVRIVALKTLLRCYLPRSSRTAYPIIEFKNLLAFDDIESTIDFIQTYGISINEEKTHIILERNTFALPDFPYVMDRSLYVVESKRTTSVGTVICGKELQARMYEHHSLQNSFDQNGFLHCKDILEKSELEQAKLKLLEELKAEIISSDEDDDKSFIQKPDSNEYNAKSFVQKPDSNEYNAKSFVQKVDSSEFTFAKNANNHCRNANILEQNVDSVSTSFKSTQSIFGNLQQQRDLPQKNQSNFTWNIDFQTPATISAVHSPLSTNFISHPIEPIMPSTEKAESDFVSDFTSLPEEKTFDETDDVPKFYRQSSVFNVAPSRSETKIEFPSLPAMVDKSVMVQESIETQEKSIAKRKQLEILRKEQELKSLESKRIEERMRELKKKKQEEELRKRMMKLQEEEMLNALEINKDVKDTVDYIVDQVNIKLNNERLAKIRDNIKRRMVLKVFNTWHNIVLRNKRKRKVMDCSPVWINSKSFQQCAAGLHIPSQSLALEFMKRYKQGEPLEIEMIRDHNACKIDIVDLTYSALLKRLQELTGKFQKNIFWKVSVSLPDARELKQGLEKIETILKSVFQWKQQYGRTIAIDQVKQNHAESMTYCIEKQKGKVVEEYDSSGIIFIAKQFSYDLQLRIYETLKSYGAFTNIPIVIILENYDENEFALEQKLTADFIILVEKFTPSGLSNAIGNGLLFLANKVGKCPPLELNTLYNFISKNLSSLTWKRANSLAKWNSNYAVCLQSPNVVIELYNEGLKKLESIIIDESLEEYAVFPKIFRKYLNREYPDYLPCTYQYFPEFWNTRSYKKLLKKTLSKLSLPFWQGTWPCLDELELEKNMLKYCESFKNPQKVFYKVMSVLLRSVDPEVNFEDINKVLWTDIIGVLGEEKIIEVDKSLKNTQFESISMYPHLIVVYDTRALDEYNTNDWFYTHNPVIKSFVGQLSEEEHVQTKNKIPETLEDTFVGDISVLPAQKLNISEVKKELENLNVLMQDLETSVKIHRKISSTLNENLKRSILDN